MPPPMIFRPRRRRRRFQAAYRRETDFHAEYAVSCFQQNILKKFRGNSKL
jgi:hypothetical protein